MTKRVKLSDLQTENKSMAKELKALYAERRAYSTQNKIENAMKLDSVANALLLQVAWRDKYGKVITLIESSRKLNSYAKMLRSSGRYNADEVSELISCYAMSGRRLWLDIEADDVAKYEYVPASATPHNYFDFLLDIVRRDYRGILGLMRSNADRATYHRHGFCNGRFLQHFYDTNRELIES